MAHISLPGRERVFAELAERGFDENAVGEMLLPEKYPNERGIRKAIPGIVRREEFSPRQGWLQRKTHAARHQKH